MLTLRSRGGSCRRSRSPVALFLLPQPYSTASPSLERHNIRYETPLEPARAVLFRTRLSEERAMYAYTFEAGRGFFEGVCRQEYWPLAFSDPPPFDIRIDTVRNALDFFGGPAVVSVSLRPSEPIRSAATRRRGLAASSPSPHLPGRCSMPPGLFRL